MKKWKQATWREPLIYELGSQGREGIVLPNIDIEIDEKYARKTPLELPQLSEVEVARHYTRLSQMAYGVDLGPVPLGSCTMKYNPKLNERVVRKLRLEYIPPQTPEEYLQGLLTIIYKLNKWLAEITGMDACTSTLPAGSSGEFAGALIIRKFYEELGERRDEMLIPDTAHGTNPASAKMAGFKVISLPSNNEGLVDIDALKTVLSDRTAGLMLTNPNTLGIFEENIVEIANLMHEAGALLYYDGANLNGILGIARPGDMGFDVVHLNLHKTFSTPHGGGGPGAGVLCVKEKLVKYLPTPRLVQGDNGLKWSNHCDGHCIGRMHSFYGNIPALVKAYTYILSLGSQGLKEVATQSVLNTNYFIALIRGTKGYELPYSKTRPRKHEVVISASPLKKETGVTANDVSKYLLDHGVHAPTVYFPLTVPEALMIEFTESEPLENIEEYATILANAYKDALQEPQKLTDAPTNTSVKRIDAVKANRPHWIIPTYRVLRKKRTGERKYEKL
ncbi:MAG: aminomethyl-transferring glycine dehydrogenase subunit GcvPB [Desulfurococcales archaeon]|nr:aminomethyl-transferring glycine dehydrogenase subunit GcvPB [Desulfurococcales archaeon]